MVLRSLSNPATLQPTSTQAGIVLQWGLRFDVMPKRSAADGDPGPAHKSVKTPDDSAWSNYIYGHVKILSPLSILFIDLSSVVNWSKSSLPLNHWVFNLQPLALPRNLEVGDGQHPVNTLLTEWVDELSDPIQTWLEEIMPGYPSPEKYNFPMDVTHRKP